MDSRSVASRRKEEKDEDRPFWETESFFEDSFDIASLCEPIEELRGPLHWKSTPHQSRPRRLKKKKRPEHVEACGEDDEIDDDIDDDLTAYFSFGQGGEGEEKSHPRGSHKSMFLLAIALLIMSIISFAVTEVLLDSLGMRVEQVIHSNLPVLDSEQFSIRSEELRNVLSTVSSDKLFLDRSSPQARALRWITHQDVLQLHAKSTNLIQRYVLAVLYYSTAPEGWNKRFNWLSGKHECEWSDGGGIRSCTKNKQVTDISLWNNLQGTLPSEIGYLTKLEVLYLARNKLQGTIPTEIGKLTALTYLGLQHNSFHGSFPSSVLGNLTKLNTVYLERNDFTGTITLQDQLCQLKKGSKLGGAIQHLTADCKTLVDWQKPELACSCCTKCYPA